MLVNKVFSLGLGMTLRPMLLYFYILERYSKLTKTFLYSIMGKAKSDLAKHDSVLVFLVWQS